MPSAGLATAGEGVVKTVEPPRFPAELFPELLLDLAALTGAPIPDDCLSAHWPVFDHLSGSSTGHLPDWLVVSTPCLSR
jgi:hypothetical protein